MFVDEQGFRIIWRSLCTYIGPNSVLEVWIRSSRRRWIQISGTEGFEWSEKPGPPKSKILLWELYANKILRRIWTLFGVKDPEQVPDHCQIIARSLKWGPWKGGSKGPAFQESHFWGFGTQNKGFNNNLEWLLCILCCVWRPTLCSNSLKVSETLVWGPGTKGPRDPKSGLWAPFVFFH